MADEQKPGDEPKAKKKRTYRKADRKRAVLVEKVDAGMTFAEAAIAAGYSDKNPAQSAYQALKPIRPVVLNIIKDAGFPIEDIFKKHLLPKLEAKYTECFAHQGLVMDRVDHEDTHLQTKVALEIARMTGCYAPEKVEVDVEHTYKVDLKNATDADLLKIISLAEGAINGAGSQGRVLPALPGGVAPGQ